MRVLIHAPLVNPGGGARLLSRLSEAIARQPEVESVRMISGSALSPPTGVDLIGTVQPDAVQDSVDRTTEQLREVSLDCDVVYFFWPHRQDFVRVDRPTVCTFQDATFFDFPEILGAETAAEWHRSAAWLQESTEVVVSSDTTRRAVMRHFGARCERATVIHHAILPAEPSEAPTRQATWVSRLPPTYVICPANVTTHKNHYTLLIAWARFTRRREHPLVFFGRGTHAIAPSSANGWGVWPYDRVAGLVSRLGLEPGADFHALGYVEDEAVMPLIGSAAALLMPTLAEGGGSYPVEEALSLGVPVLCSDIPVMREHLSQRSAQIAWFDPESPDSIAGALEYLFDHYNAYKQSALAGMSDARPSWDDVAAQYVRVFARAIEGRG